MTAYLIADIDVKDATAYEDYRRLVGATVDKFGGRFLARGGAPKPFEGDWTPTRVVIIEFPDMAALEAWYNSPDYRPLLKLRMDASKGRLIAVEGL